MMRRLIRACVAMLLAAVGGTSAVSAQSLTEALSEAYRTNPQLLAQRALLRATDELVPQALANWRPTVAFTGQTGFTRSASAQLPGLTSYTSTNPSSLDLILTQPVYRGGRTEAQTRQAINTVEATRAQTLAVETTVFQAVAQAYLDVVRDQTLVLVQRNNERVLRCRSGMTPDRSWRATQPSSIAATTPGTLLRYQFGEPVTGTEIARALMSRTEYLGHPRLRPAPRGISSTRP
jgi:outer membrane protein